jgi:TatA/E family protein of Tat protein translocase
VFGISGFKLLIIIVAVLVLVGPDKLPEIGRTVGKAIAMFKRAQEDMQSVINAEMFSGNSDPESSGPAEATATVASQLYTATDEDEDEEEEDEE